MVCRLGTMPKMIPDDASIAVVSLTPIFPFLFYFFLFFPYFLSLRYASIACLLIGSVYPFSLRFPFLFYSILFYPISLFLPRLRQPYVVLSLKRASMSHTSFPLSPFPFPPLVPGCSLSLPLRWYSQVRTLLPTCVCSARGLCSRGGDSSSLVLSFFFFFFLFV